MKIARKLYLGSSSLILSAMLVAGVAKVRADSDADDEANFGVRGNRITSNCVVNGGILVVPQVPPPATTPSPDPCNGLVTPLINIPSANNRWRPNGILVTNNPHQLWAGDGNGDIRVYSLDNKGTSPALLKIVSHQDPLIVALLGAQGAQRRADELAYDPDDQLVLMAWDDDLDLFVALVSVSSNPNNIKVVKTISFKTNCPAFGGCATAGIEQPVYDHDSNRFYIAIPASTGHPNGEIVRINPKTMAVDGAFDTTGTAPAAGVPCFPHGLTLGPRQNLLLGCSGDGATGTQMISIIMKATNGAVLKTFNQLGGSDEVYYDKGNNTYFLAMSSWTSSGKTGTGNPTPSLGIIDAGSSDSGNEAPEWIQNILTTRTSHSVAAGYGFRCDFDDHGRSECGRHEPNEGNDVVRKFAYVPLTIVPVPLTGSPLPTVSETGGIGIYGRLP